MRDVEAIPETMAEGDEKMHDFYYNFDPYKISALDTKEYNEYFEGLTEEERLELESGKNAYEITFENIGGLVMPLIVEFELESGEKVLHHIPAEIWKMSEPTVTKVFVTDGPAVQVTLDPYLETADTETVNNYWPARPVPTKFELFKKKKYQGKGGENPMQRDARSNALGK